MSLNLEQAEESIRLLPEHERSRAEREFLLLAALYREAVRERDELRAGLMIPGEYRCVECGFELHKLVILAATGDIGKNEQPLFEDCPNGHGPLIGVSYEQGFRDMVRVAGAAAARAEVLNDKLDSVDAAYREAVEALGHVGKCSTCAEAWLDCEKGRKAQAVLAKARTAGIGPEGGK